MNWQDNNESPPLIVKETSKLLQYMETNEEQIFKGNRMLEDKITYEQKLTQHLTVLNKSAAEKRAACNKINERTSWIDKANLDCRNTGQASCILLNSAFQKNNDLASIYTECVEKEDKEAKKIRLSKANYDKKMEDLNNLLNKLIGKRTRKLETLGTQKEDLLKENADLKKRLEIYEEKEKEIQILDTDESDTGDLETDLKDLENKIKILEDDYLGLQSKNVLVESAKDEIAKKYDESVFRETSVRSSEVKNEILQLSQNMQDQRNLEDQENNKYRTLKEYEKQLDEAMREATNFWEQLQSNEYGGFSRLEQEISKIRSDIIERNQKYAAMEEEKLTSINNLKKKDEEIEAFNPKVEKYISELNEVGETLQKLKTSEDLTEQYKTMSHKISELNHEKDLLEQISSEKSLTIKQITDEINKANEKEHMEHMVLENRYQLETKELEKEYFGVEGAKNKLENDAKAAETQIKELEKIKNELEEKSALRIESQNEVEKTIVEAQRLLKINTLKKDEAKKKLASYSTPPPIYVKRDDSSQDFARPKTPESKKVLKKVASPKANRNWDSDSSMEGEEVKLSDFLKRKQRRRSDSGK